MAFLPGSQEADTNGTTNVVAVSSPASGVTRQVSQVVVHNVDTVSAIANVYYDNGAAVRRMFRTTLNVGESMTVGGFILDSSAEIEVDLDAAHTTTAPTIVASFADFS
jgi:hypothetical protein